MKEQLDSQKGCGIGGLAARERREVESCEETGIQFGIWDFRFGI